MRAINRVTYLTLALVVLASLGLLPQVQAVSPTPEQTYSDAASAADAISAADTRTVPSYSSRRVRPAYDRQLQHQCWQRSAGAQQCEFYL